MTELLAHRDTLAAAIHATICPYRRMPLFRTCECAGWADALFASGAVRDAASLPDDEGLVFDVGLNSARALSDSEDSLTLGAYRDEASRVLAALAAALAPTEEKA